MRHNKLSGKAAENSPWINNLTAPKRHPLAAPRGENRATRRENERAVRLELKRIAREFPKLKMGTKAHKEMGLKKAELEMWQAGSHESVNVPFVKVSS